MPDPTVDRSIESLHNMPFSIGQPVNPQYLTTRQLVTDEDACFDVSSDLLSRHMAVLGASGSGKSKYLELFCRHLIDSCNGFTFIDPHGDTAELLLGYANRLADKYGDDFILDRFHYLKPTPQMCFSFDPLQISVPDTGSVEFEAARETAVKKLVRVILRSEAQAEEEKMRRLKRWLTNGLTAIATPLADGRRLTLSELRAVLFPSDPNHSAIIDQYRSVLPLETRQDFDFISSLSQPQHRDDRLESTINRISDFCTTMSRVVFGGQAPSVNCRNAVRDRHIVIVNLAETEFLSREAGDAIADFIINDVRNACAETPKSKRVPHHLIIDEASEYMADDLGRFLDQARKWKLSVCLAAQHLSNFKKGEIDITDQLIGNCKMFVSFQQRSLEDVRLLGEFFGKPNLILQERMQVMDRPDPDSDEIITLVDRGRSMQRSNATAVGTGRGSTESNGVAISRARSTAKARMFARGVTDNFSSSVSTAKTVGKSSAAGKSKSSGMSMSPMMIDGQLLTLPSEVVGEGSHTMSGLSESESNARSSSTGHGRSSTEAVTDGITIQDGNSLNFASAQAFNESLMKTISQAFGESVTEKQSLVQRTKEFWYGTGDARYAIPYQYALHEFLLTTLPQRYAFMRSDIEGLEQTCVFRVGFFESHSLDEDEEMAFLERLYLRKNYMFQPKSPDKLMEKRVLAFLVQVPKQPEASSDPNPVEDLFR